MPPLLPHLLVLAAAALKSKVALVMMDTQLPEIDDASCASVEQAATVFAGETLHHKQLAQ